MKKLQHTFLIAISCLMLSGVAHSQTNNVLQTQPAGFVFQPTSVKVNTIKDIANKKDDEIIVLRGSIEKALGDEKYLFNDGTDTVVIEIDSDDFRGVVVSAGELIQITGDVDKGGIFKADKIDVKNIQKLTK